MNGLSGLKFLAMSAAVAALVACGSGTTSSNTMEIAGTAAVGKELVGAHVVVTCVEGSGSADTDGIGGYVVTITDGKGPCVLTATKGNTVLRSVTPGAGTVNITPLTDMMVEFLAVRAGTSPDKLLSNDNSKGILADVNALTDAQVKVANFVQTNYGITLSTTNFLTVKISPPAAGNQSASDKDLDLLMAKGVLETTGVPKSTVIAVVKTEAQKEPPYIVTTGSTGGTGS